LRTTTTSTTRARPSRAARLGIEGTAWRDFGYLSARYFLTGEPRNCDGEDGAFDRIEPLMPLHGGLGAGEIAVRVDYLDLKRRDLDVDAGEQTSHIAGVNWYPNANLRPTLNGALTRVADAEDSPGVVGDASTIYGAGMRAQVDF
jgi:phosphate-selective porin